MKFSDLLNEFHIMPQFPPAAMRQAENIPDTVAEKDLQGRKDLTEKLIVTIDGEDAKDFDDAVSVEVLENGNYCLGVHIADVTHYVKENSSIDRAAFTRGTSVYLIDTVIPMLPFELSNELCSLKPHVVRLAVSVFMEITPRGKVKSYEICNSFIKSAERMTYSDVTAILEGDKALNAKYSHLVSMFSLMAKLANILKRKRISEGSIEFETHESKITLDETGTPVAVERYPITFSNNIIEEFMLVCNVTVAKHLVSKGLPCVFRVHERPDMMRLERLGEILPLLGVDFKYNPDVRPKDFQNILNEVRDTEKAEVISYLLLRAMAKAKYSEINAGHFGLGFDTYCHFTSPIRRYSDVAVHRVLKESLKGELSEKQKAHFKEVAASAAVTATVTEVNAADAELQWKSVKKAEYMVDKIGERDEGIITHVLSSGFFVELPNTVEGFVAARTLEDDVYVMTENGISMSGLSNGRSFTVGDKVKIKVVAADPERRFVDFEIVGAAKLRPMKRKSNRKDSVMKKNKNILREITENGREEKLEKAELRRKYDSEKEIFESALISVVFEEIREKHRFSRDEERFAGVILDDMAARISQPVFKSVVSDSSAFSDKTIYISATVNLKNTIGILEESFDFEVDEKTVDMLSQYSVTALRHFGKCMRFDGFDWKKREKEYFALLQKLKRKVEE